MARFGFIAGAVIIVIASVFFGFRKAAREHAAADAQATGSPAARPTAIPPGAASSARAALPADSPLLKPRSHRRIDPQSRKLLVDEIAAARARRTQAPGADQELSKEYVQAQVQEIVPLVEACYEEALEDDPDLAGKLAVAFAIGGEPEVGGLVESSEIVVDKTTIAHGGLIECVRETMYGIELVAPPEGGRVLVNYAFQFSPKEQP